MSWGNLPTSVLSILAVLLVFYPFYRAYLKHIEKIDEQKKNKEIELEKQKTERMKKISNDLSNIIQSDDLVRTASIICANDEKDSLESCDKREQICKELTEEYKQLAISNMQEVLLDKPSREVTPVRQPENGKRIQSSGDREGVKEN